MDQVVREIADGLGRISALHQGGSYDEALDLTRQLLARFPGCAALWLRAGMLMQLARNDVSPLEEVDRCFENARALSPRDAEPSIELGYFLYAVRNDAMAGGERFQEAADKARSLLHEALVGQIKCAAELSDREGVLVMLAQAQSTFPGDREFEALHDEVLPSSPPSSDES